MAKEAGDIAWNLGYDVFYIANSESELNAWSGAEVVILESDLNMNDKSVFSIGIGDSRIRKNIYKRYMDKLEFINLIHPEASFGKGQRERLNDNMGLIVAAGARFTNSISLGDFSIINQNVTIAHDCQIGEFVHIASNSTISGNVKICDHAWLGAGVIINQGANELPLEIGGECVIGSGSVVVKDCEAGRTYIGVPARCIS